MISVGLEAEVPIRVERLALAETGEFTVLGHRAVVINNVLDVGFGYELEVLDKK